jgi:hypothetical protein
MPFQHSAPSARVPLPFRHRAQRLRAGGQQARQMALRGSQQQLAIRRAGQRIDHEAEAVEVTDRLVIHQNGARSSSRTGRSAASAPVLRISSVVRRLTKRSVRRACSASDSRVSTARARAAISSRASTQSGRCAM